MEPEDVKILKEGTVDYIGLSYYMTNVVQAGAVGSGAATAGFEGSVPNPHVKHLTGASKSIRLVFVMHLIYFMNVIKNRYLS